MDIPEVVETAKSYLAKLYADEKVRDIALEEIDYRDMPDQWIVKLSFRRGTERTDTAWAAAAAALAAKTAKVLTINGEGKLISVKDALAIG